MSTVSTTSAWTADVPSPAAMVALGQKLAPLVAPPAVALLSGPLGSGKTTLVRAVAEALGAQGPIRSPSFDLVHRHPLPDGRWLYHVDLYRLADAVPDPDMLDVWDPEGLVLVEWGAPWARWFPDRLEVVLTFHNAGRRVSIAAFGKLRERFGRWREEA
jgi:tRNA threonylcarbamoyladenosine biosynthesis protein TsaE